MHTNYNKAAQFIHQYYSENKSQGAEKRLEEIREELSSKSVYTLTKSELEYGCKLAWRNSNRCIGRLFWNSLKVKDNRKINSAEEVFEALKSHIKFTYNKGKIKSVVSVFNPKNVKIYNQQLIRYAGYKLSDGNTIGDPDMIEFTDYCIKLGWKAQHREFDVLPLVIQIGSDKPKLFELPIELIPEVKLEHPAYSWFKELNLKWYAVPIISNMVLEIGGIQYHAAPFNGWYMSTEIASRNLADSFRYNKLPLIAKQLGLDTSKNKNLWKDHALLILNEAVLFSFQQANVQIVDHHSASQQFMQFVHLEDKNGREVTGDWSWLVPPMSGASTEIFHHEWNNKVKSPNFYYRSSYWKEGEKKDIPKQKCPFHINSIS